MNNNQEFKEDSRCKLRLLKYIHDNYDKVVITPNFGSYIEIDLNPYGTDGMNHLIDMQIYCNQTGIDMNMFMHSYPRADGDGIRMNRFYYYMQETTQKILADYEVLYGPK